MATDYGDPDLQVRIGHMYYMGNKDGIKNHVQARRYYQLAAAQGNAEAQATLGQMLSRGEGGPRDLVEARRMNTLAAAQGHAVAQTFLGIMYYQGDGGAQDFVEARRQLRLHRKSTSREIRPQARRELRRKSRRRQRESGQRD